MVVDMFWGLLGKGTSLLKQEMTPLLEVVSWGCLELLQATCNLAVDESPPGQAELSRILALVTPSGG